MFDKVCGDMAETMLDTREKVNQTTGVTKKRPDLIVITATISTEFKTKVERAAEIEQRSISNLITRALTFYIRDMEAQGLFDEEPVA